MKKKLLLAEDSPTIQSIARKALEMHGFVVVTASDGIAALEKAYTEWPDGILLDLTMPHLNGLQVLRLLRAQDYFQHIPIVMLTGREDDVYLSWTHTLGADAYFVKPQGLGEFAATVQKITDFLGERFAQVSVAPPSARPVLRDRLDVLAYAFDSLYHSLFTYTLHYQFLKESDAAHDVVSLAQRSLRLLEKAFGPLVYFLLLAGTPPFLFVLSPFATESAEHAACVRLIVAEFQQYGHMDGGACSVRAENLHSHISMDMQHVQLRGFPVCDRQKCSARGERSAQSCRHCGGVLRGLLGVISDRPLIAEQSSALDIIARSIPEKSDTLLLRTQMKALEPVKAYNSLLHILNNSKDLGEILVAGVAEIANFSRSQAAIWFQMESDRKNLVARNGFSVSDPVLLAQTIAVGHGMVGRVAASQAPLIVKDTEECGLQIDTGFGQVRPKELLFVPVVFRDNLLGVLALASIYAYPEECVEHVRGMAHQFAVGLNNALVHEQVSRLAASLEKQNESLKRQYEEIKEQQLRILSQGQELDRKNRELEDANRHKSEFLASMSHELRTPLNAMIGYTALTLNSLQGKVEEAHLKNLGRAEQAAKSLLQLINDVLDFSKIEAGKMDVLLEDVNLRDVIGECLETAEGLTLKKNIALKSELAADLPEVHSDYTKLKQIITNLLSNAVKFTDHGHVSLCALRDGERVRVDVEDTGCGIPEDKIGSLFQSFRQLDGSIRKRFGGTGLGLAISKKFCDMLGIAVEVSSKPGAGSTFRLLLPLDARTAGQPAAGQQPLPAINTPVVAEAPTAAPADEAKAAVICLTADDFRQSLAQRFADLPLAVQKADTFAHCQAMAQAQPTWAVVFDPAAADAETTCQCRQQKALNGIPVIELTSSPDIEAMARAVEMARIRSLLIVDDNDVNLQLLAAIFGKAGYAVMAAESGPASIAAAKTQPPDVVLMDLAMPGMDGFAATAEIQRVAGDSVVIACSAFNTEEFRQKAMAAGCAGYLSKPIEPNRLEEQVKNIAIKAKIKSICSLTLSH